jgi:hypothetical protein
MAIHAEVIDAACPCSSDHAPEQLAADAGPAKFRLDAEGNLGGRVFDPVGMHFRDAAHDAILKISDRFGAVLTAPFGKVERVLSLMLPRNRLLRLLGSRRKR